MVCTRKGAPSEALPFNQSHYVFPRRLRYQGLYPLHEVVDLRTVFRGSLNAHVPHSHAAHELNVSQEHRQGAVDSVKFICTKGLRRWYNTPARLAVARP